MKAKETKYLEIFIKFLLILSKTSGRFYLPYVFTLESCKKVPYQTSIPILLTDWGYVTRKKTRSTPYAYTITEKLKNVCKDGEEIKQLALDLLEACRNRQKNLDESERSKITNIPGKIVL